jgi:D-aminoacyl-tRNA deacylase
MRSVVQRVQSARVTVEGLEVGSIGKGLCALVGVGVADTQADAVSMADRLAELRIFEDEGQRMNLSALDVRAEVLLVSQFTLFGDTRRGRRPSFTSAMEPLGAKVLFERVRDRLTQRGVRVATGKFRAEMLVEIRNDGPVTLLLDTAKLF